MKKVTIIQRILYQYRINFYEMLSKALFAEGYMLQLIIEKNKSKSDMRFLSNFHIKRNISISVFKYELIYQPYMDLLRDSELVILELRNSLILNHILLIKKLLGSKQKIAFWGHAINMQTDKNNIRNILKRSYIKYPDWWFPYTENMAAIVRNTGYAEDRITTLYNTTNTEQMAEQSKSIKENEISQIRSELGLTRNRTAIFCGRIYKEKRIDFLLEACSLIQKQLPEFRIVIIGDGEDAYKVIEASKHSGRIRYMGPVFEREKALYFKLADIFLSPGLVGLSVTDSFAFKVPIITTDYPYHSPEIEYLENDKNGIITKNDMTSYVNAVVDTLNNKVRLNELKKGCLHASEKYTMRNMVSNFVSGINACLKT